LYLGVHYPTDVLAGAVVGTGSAWLAYKANKWLFKKKKVVAEAPRY
jgi:membrane-associated phospholipid phosphatase